jgi:hypothetical protein
MFLIILCCRLKGNSIKAHDKEVLTEALRRNINLEWVRNNCPDENKPECNNKVLVDCLKEEDVKTELNDGNIENKPTVSHGNEL